MGDIGAETGGRFERLGRLLEPRSIAVVGATDRTDSYGDIILRNLERLSYEGELWGINPKREEIRGIPCLPSVSDLPGPVDALAVAVPAALVPGVIREGGELGCGGAVVVSAGFGEVESGRQHEMELLEATRLTGMPLCGPNGNGFVSFPAGAAIWGDTVQPMPAGGVAMISQSGNVAVNALGSRRGIGFHTVISTGNQTVTDASEWLAALAHMGDRGVRSVALFLEADGDGPRFASALADCVDAGIGVAVLKVGSSEAGAGAASAHTGSLAGDQRVFRALVEEAGGAWAEDPHDLLEMARVLASRKARPHREAGGGLAILTCSGGDSGIAADTAERLDIPLPALRPETSRRLRELLPEAATVGNPLDYTTLVWAERELLAEIVETAAGDPGIDQVLLFHDTPEGEVSESWKATRRGLAEGAARGEAAPLFASTLPDLIGEEEIRELTELGVPAVQGLATAMRCVAALRRLPGDPDRLREIAATASGAPTTPDGPGEHNGWLGEAEAKDLLARHGVQTPARLSATDADGAVEAGGELGLPVALKLSSPAIQHKSDLGAIAIGLTDFDSLRAAAARMLELPEASGAHLLVERMADPGPELIVAVRTDAVVPALVIGLGGVWTEVLADVAVVPLPAGAGRIEAAIHGLRGAGLLTGARGAEPVDLGAVSESIAAIARAAIAEGLSLLEINPLIAAPSGPVVVDALARR